MELSYRDLSQVGFGSYGFNQINAQVNTMLSTKNTMIIESQLTKTLNPFFIIVKDSTIFVP